MRNPVEQGFAVLPAFLQDGDWSGIAGRAVHSPELEGSLGRVPITARSMGRRALWGPFPA